MSKHTSRYRYEALAALGFKCSCGAIKDLHFVHVLGYKAHKRLAKLIDYQYAIAKDHEVRKLYKLACSACRVKHDESLRDDTQEQASSKKGSKQA